MTIIGRIVVGQDSLQLGPGWQKHRLFEAVVQLPLKVVIGDRESHFFTPVGILNDNLRRLPTHVHVRHYRRQVCVGVDFPASSHLIGRVSRLNAEHEVRHLTATSATNRLIRFSRQHDTPATLVGYRLTDGRVVHLAFDVGTGRKPDSHSLRIDGTESIRHVAANTRTARSGPLTIPTQLRFTRSWLPVVLQDLRNDVVQYPTVIRPELVCRDPGVLFKVGRHCDVGIGHGAVGWNLKRFKHGED